MGWTFSHREKGVYSDLEWFRKQFGKHEDGGERVLATASVNWSEVYMAYRTKENKVVGVICLVKWVRNDYFNFGYKDMEEGSGPRGNSCPKRILDTLSPLEELYSPRTDGEEGSYEWAKNWRERCYTNLEKRKKMGVGDALNFKTPIKFTNGFTFKQMVVASIKPLRLVSPGSNLSTFYCYRVSRGWLMDNIETIIPAKDALAAGLYIE